MSESRIRPTRRLAALVAAAGPDRSASTLAKVLAFGPEGYVEETISSVERLTELRGCYPVVWVDVEGHSDLAALEAIRTSLGLHPLAVEDVVSVGQRPKYEEYDENLFVVLREVRFDARALVTEQVSLFMSPGCVATFQELVGDSFDGVRERIRAGRGRLRRAPADYLFYALIDAVVDSYFPVVESIGDRIEQLEESVLLESEPDVISQIHQSRRELLVARKAIVPLRDALDHVPNEESSFISGDTRLYFRDVVDHLNRAVDLVDAYRDLSHSVMDAHLSVLSARLNDVISFLTIISTTFIPLSFLVGVWGMNFDPDASPWNMPELRHRYGYPLAIGFMVMVGLGQLLFYYRRGWIRIRRRRAHWTERGTISTRKR